ncbi:MAG: hypothetical protein EPO65_06270 [Dehalococcoidia bacterium]|nr:MAG: hypothetical protein EPO65_06270 [Dehalococcoidia bacterium]
MAGHEDEERGDDAPVTPRELLRGALVDAADPRFPRWLPLPGALFALGWAGYQTAAMDAGFLPTLLWPGVAIFALVTVAAWFGWQLEID